MIQQGVCPMAGEMLWGEIWEGGAPPGSTTGGMGHGHLKIKIESKCSRKKVQKLWYGAKYRKNLQHIAKK